VAKPKKPQKQEEVHLEPEPNYDPEEAGNKTLDEGVPPDVEGEQSLGGDMPDPEADDDVLEAAHKAGLALGEDYEHPKPVDIAEDVAKAEKGLREK
jgi:hypothetical protein